MERIQLPSALVCVIPCEKQGTLWSVSKERQITFQRTSVSFYREQRVFQFLLFRHGRVKRNVLEINRHTRIPVRTFEKNLETGTSTKQLQWVHGD